MKRVWKKSIEELPKNLHELLQLDEGKLQNPQDTAACYIAAIVRYAEDPAQAYDMINYLNGPNIPNEYDKRFFEDRFETSSYIARSYLEGSSPENDYTPTKPYTVSISSDEKSYEYPGLVKLYIKSTGCSDPRPIILKKKNETGQWFVWGQMLLSGITKPVSDNEWQY